MAKGEMQQKVDILLQKINIPFFRNNPEYLDCWISYYNSSPDPQILLLMYYKQIGTLHHWLYVEFAKHFVKIQKIELAHFVLEEAINNNVYDRSVLQIELDKLPSFKKKYRRSDLMCILKQNNIKALGQIWNAFKEEQFHQKYLKCGSTFEIMKIRDYSEMYGVSYDESGKLPEYEVAKEVKETGMYAKTVYYSTEEVYYSTEEPKNDENNGENNDAESMSSLPNDTSLIEESNSGDLLENKRSKLCENQKENEANDGTADLGTCEAKQNEMVQFPVLKGTIEVNEELYLENYIYIVQELSDKKDGSFTALRIAFGKDDAQTVAGRTFYFQRISEAQREFARLFYGVCTHKNTLHNNSTLYAVFEYDCLISLGDVLPHCTERVKIFYFHQIILFLEKCKAHDLLFCDIDFFVDQSFSVHPMGVCFKVYSPEEHEVLLSKLVAHFSLAVPETQNFDFFVEEAVKTLKEPSFKKELLQHKNAVLELV